MHWIYVLIEEHNGEILYYIGESRRLGGRLREHEKEKNVFRLFALYKLANEVLWKHAVDIDNETRGDAQCNKSYACKLEREMYSQLEKSRKKTAVSNANYTFCDFYRPMCNCPYKIPCEVFQCKRGRNQGRFFFGCVKKNMQDWLHEVSPFKFDDEACDFFEWACEPKAIALSETPRPQKFLILEDA